ncbi:MAG TPA: MarR family transcriptional regulator [Pseudoxanthomonas sp.]|nr:MarR family transcriptional regulator [Pseudoxanthomonas sp.]
MQDFIEQQGPAFLAHLLRRVADELVNGAASWYPSAGVTAPPRTISTLLALQDHGPLGVTELATMLRQSHPLVIVWIKELTALSLIASKAHPGDGRKTLIRLTAKGKKEVGNVRKALLTMEKASKRLMDEGGADVWASLWRIERACRKTPFAERLRQMEPDR